MKVAIVHYHLGAGGVTQVIAAASRALARRGVAQVILSGADGAPEMPAAVRVIDGLGYGGCAAEGLLDRVRAAAHDALGGPPDLWHFHNHSLGKNAAMPKLVERLALANERLLLQIHDLAEDGRPENAPLLAGCRNLYPLAPQVHYAFLNTRDRDWFVAAGLPPHRAHWLPNPVDVPSLPPAPPGPPVLFAPLRGIRRKNLGELVLLAALAPPGTRIAVARAPRQAQWRPVFDGWRRFARELQLPVEFGVVDEAASAAEQEGMFAAWLERATHFVTTSVAEGFGMVFLEAIARGRPLLGRSIPHLARDHAALGVTHGMLYQHLWVPEEWVDGDALDGCLAMAMDQTWQAWESATVADRRYSSEGESATVIDRRYRSVLRRDGMLDFGNLPECLQQRVIQKAMQAGMAGELLVECEGSLMAAPQWLAETLACRECADAAPLTRFSPAAHAGQLHEIYQQVRCETPAAPASLDRSRILDAGLAPENFQFLTAHARFHRPPPDFRAFRAVICDVYGTLLDAPAGGVKPDSAADPLLREIIASCGYEAPASPSAALHAAVLRHHASSGKRWPEVDLREMWREVLALPPDHDTTPLVIAIEAAWHPAQPLPGAAETLHALSDAGVLLGLLSNAQINTLPALDGMAAMFAPDLTILSYQHGMAKPAPELFALLLEKLAARGIAPHETLYIGNDPLHDIEPAAACGLRTALFTGHPASQRAGACLPDHLLDRWPAARVDAWNCVSAKRRDGERAEESAELV